MKKYIIKASYITYLTAEIEAEDYHEAYEIAHNMDGGSFDQVDQDDWSVDEIGEISE